MFFLNLFILSSKEIGVGMHYCRFVLSPKIFLMMRLTWVKQCRTVFLHIRVRKYSPLATIYCFAFKPIPSSIGLWDLGSYIKCLSTHQMWSFVQCLSILASLWRYFCDDWVLEIQLSDGITPLVGRMPLPVSNSN